MIRNVFFIGPMGAGKTTIGKRVARLLSLDFHDVDSHIESGTGADVGLIFDIEGEAGFRDRETLALDDLTSRHGVLVATGGGAVLSAENRKMLAARGLVVYLCTSVSRQLQRLSQDRRRPLLQTADRSQKLADLAAVRNPLYQEVADITVAATDASVKESAARVARLIEQALP